MMPATMLIAASHATLALRIIFSVSGGQLLQGLAAGIALPTDYGSYANSSKKAPAVLQVETLLVR